MNSIITELNKEMKDKKCLEFYDKEYIQRIIEDWLDFDELL